MLLQKLVSRMSKVDHRNKV